MAIQLEESLEERGFVQLQEPPSYTLGEGWVVRKPAIPRYVKEGARIIEVVDVLPTSYGHHLYFRKELYVGLTPRPDDAPVFLSVAGNFGREGNPMDEGAKRIQKHLFL